MKLHKDADVLWPGFGADSSDYIDGSQAALVAVNGWHRGPASIGGGPVHLAAIGVEFMAHLISNRGFRVN